MDNNIFYNELKVLNQGKELVRKDDHQNPPLISDYKYLLHHYEKLLKVTKKAFTISDLQGEALKKREAEIENLLNNANQGFLTFREDLLVHAQYSAECERIFQKKIHNIPIIDLLWNKDDRNINNYISLLKGVFSDNDKCKYMEKLKQLPQHTVIHNRDIKLEFKKIEQYNEQLLMLILTDETEKLKYEKKVQYLSYCDSLTSLYNRNYMEEIMNTVVNDKNMPLGIMTIDLNALKLTNDVFGHNTGDHLIVQSANILKKCSREEDIIIRWGGDEFFVLLPKADEELIETMKANIKFECSKSQESPVEITMAIGMNVMHSVKENIYDLSKIAEKRMYKEKLLERKQVRNNIVQGIEKMLLTTQCQVPGHTERMKEMLIRFTEICGFLDSKFKSKNIELLAYLHEVGKVAIPAEILTKKDPLTSEEWEVVKSHSEIGYRMAQSIGETTVAEAILSMRERWDGKGYPYGLKGEEIPIYSRFIAIIDTFDSMTHDRAFQKAVSDKRALQEIKINSGSQFDPELVEVFIENFEYITKLNNNTSKSEK